MVPAHPLQWPISRDRNKSPEPTSGSVVLSTTYEHVFKQLEQLGARKVVISSNAILKKDGLPSARQPKVVDAGVAVWFQWPSVQSSWCCISCDSYNSIEGNLKAIRLAISDIRKLMRRLNMPFINMFIATPPQAQSQQQKPPRQEAPPNQERRYESSQYWRNILSVPLNASWPEIKRAYYQLAKIHHPDSGGSSAQFQELGRAYSEAKKFFGVN